MDDSELKLAELLGVDSTESLYGWDWTAGRERFVEWLEVDGCVNGWELPT